MVCGNMLQQNKSRSTAPLNTPKNYFCRFAGILCSKTHKSVWHTYLFKYLRIQVCLCACCVKHQSTLCTHVFCRKCGALILWAGQKYTGRHKNSHKRMWFCINVSKWVSFNNIHCWHSIKVKRCLSPFSWG